MTAHDFSVNDIAVVVAFKNEASFLKACVDTLIEASDKRAELIFVNDASSDNFASILSPYSDKITLLHSDGCGPGKARNIAWRQTERRYIAFLDADCRVEARWFDHLVEQLSGQPSDVSSVGGIQLPYQGAGRSELFYAALLNVLGFVSDYLHQVTNSGYVLHNPTCNVIYDKRALIDAQGFDENLWPCEDLELDIRLSRMGWKAMFSSQIVVEHKKPETFLALMKMMRRYGFGHSKLWKKHGFCQKIHVLPILLVSILFIAMVSSFVSYIYLLIIGFVGLLLLIVILVGRSRSLVRGTLYLPYTIGILFAWHLGFFTGLISSQKIAKQNG
ncbi:MAG: glycosyltransferase [Bdellovibrionales bacterium]|nr:glycosyltransferase [Bdellovibrionales bacterium]